MSDARVVNQADGLAVMAAEIGGGWFSTSLYGPHAIAARVRILQALTGQKVTRADAAWNKFADLIRQTFTPDAQCVAASDKQIDALIATHLEEQRAINSQLTDSIQRREIGAHVEQELAALTPVELATARRVIMRLSVAADRDARQFDNATRILTAAAQLISDVLAYEDDRREETFSPSDSNRD